jgi:hypothetical protein
MIGSKLDFALHSVCVFILNNPVKLVASLYEIAVFVDFIF